MKAAHGDFVVRLKRVRLMCYPRVSILDCRFRAFGMTMREGGAVITCAKRETAASRFAGPPRPPHSTSFTTVRVSGSTSITRSPE